MAFMGRTLERVKSKPKRQTITIEGYLEKYNELQELKKDLIEKYEQIKDPKHADKFKKMGIKAITRKEDELSVIKEQINKFTQALNAEMKRYQQEQETMFGASMGESKGEFVAKSQQQDFTQSDNDTTMVDECYQLLKTCATKEEYQELANEVSRRHMQEVIERLNNKQDEKANLELE